MSVARRGFLRGFAAIMAAISLPATVLVQIPKKYLYVVDTSGSIPTEMLKTFLDELSCITQSAPDSSFKFVMD